MARTLGSLLMALVLSGCLSAARRQQAAEARKPTPTERLKVPKQLTLAPGTQIKLERNEGESGPTYLLRKADLSDFDSWPAPPIKIVTMPSPSGLPELGVSWRMPDINQIYTKVQLCLRQECIHQLTNETIASFPSYPKAWNGARNAQVRVSVCADDESGRCTPAGTQTVDLRKFPLGPGSEKVLERMKNREERIQYSTRYFDIMEEYRSRAEGAIDEELPVSQGATDNVLNSGRVSVAIGMADMDTLEFNEMRLGRRIQEVGLDLTSKRVDRWFYHSEYLALNDDMKDRFEHAQLNPGVCGFLKWRSKEGPLVNKYDETYNEHRLIECIKKRVKDKKTRIYHHNVSSDSGYQWGRGLAITGIIGGVVAFFAICGPCRIIFHWVSLLNNDLLGFFGVMYDSGRNFVNKWTVGGLVVGVAAAVVGFVLMDQAQDRHRLANVKHPAWVYFEGEAARFLEGMPERLMAEN